MMAKRCIEKNLENYFKLAEERNRIEYELIKLNNLYNHMNFVSNGLDQSGKKVLEKRILELERRLVIITIDNIGIEYALKNLKKCEKNILEMRLKDNKTFEYIGNKLYISKSTAFRRFNAILDEMDIKVEEYNYKSI